MPFDSENYQPTDAILNNLIEARARIANQNNWCTGTRLRYVDGVQQHCAMGALDAVIGKESDQTDACRWLANFASAQMRSVYKDPAAQIAQTNNRGGHKATLEMFDRAIVARHAELASELTRAA